MKKSCLKKGPKIVKNNVHFTDRVKYRNMRMKLSPIHL